MRTSRVVPLLLAFLAACSPQGGSNAQTTHSLGGPVPDLAEPNRAPPPDFKTMKMSFAPIVRRAAPAVVNVYSTRVVRAQVDPFWQFFGGGMGVPQNRVEGSLGSGVIVRPDGLIVTNNHVIEGGQSLVVVLNDRREFPAKVVLADPLSDLAVLKIDVKGERLAVLPLAARDTVQVGDLVLAIGNPFGVGQTVTNGIVSALARTDVGANDFSFFIQTDAAINPGNSGGPLVDMDGNLIGLNTLIYSRTGSSAGIGFAIPAAMVRRVVESAVGGGHEVERPWLGARTQTVDADTAKSLGLDRAGGAMVVSTFPGGPAARAGLEEGDVILAADGDQVADEGVLTYKVATHRPGEVMRVQVRRHGTVKPVEVRLEAPPSTPKDERRLVGRQPLSGATVVNLSPGTADAYGLDPMQAGVLITKAGEGYAAEAGFQSGDIILEINGRAVSTTAAVAAALQNSDGWRIVIQRGGRKITANFGL